MNVRIAIAGLVALAVLGGCGKQAETTGGTVKPASSSETTATTAAPTTTTQKLTTTTTEAPTTTTTGATKSVSYANCSEVKAAGAAPIHRGDPGYSTKLDRDGDGVACEN